MELMIKITGLYDSNPKAEYSMLEIARKLKATYSLIHKTVQRMAAEGVLTCAAKGSARMCTINLASDRARAFLTLYAVNRKEAFFSKKKDMGELLGEFVRRTADENVYAVLLFGSYAKGTEKERSDIDLLVICASKAKADRKVAAETNSMQARYGRELNPIVVDKGMFMRSLNSPETAVAKEAQADHIILSGHEHFWRFVSEALQ